MEVSNFNYNLHNTAESQRFTGFNFSGCIEKFIDRSKRRSLSGPFLKFLKIGKDWLPSAGKNKFMKTYCPTQSSSSDAIIQNLSVPENEVRYPILLIYFAVYLEQRDELSKMAVSNYDYNLHPTAALLQFEYFIVSEQRDELSKMAVSNYDYNLHPTAAPLQFTDFIVSGYQTDKNVRSVLLSDNARTRLDDLHSTDTKWIIQVMYRSNSVMEKRSLRSHEREELRSNETEQLSEETEQLSEETEQLRSDEREQLSEETQQLRRYEREELRSDETEQLSEETEQLRNEETKQLRSDETEQLSEETEQLRSNETEQLSEETEQLSEETEQLRIDEREELRSEETEQLRSDETEELSEETEQLRSDETEQLSEETEQVRSDEREQLRSDETEQLSEETEQLRTDEREELSEETEQLRSDETEQLSEETEQLSEEREQLRTDEREELRSDETEQLSEETEQLRSDEREQLSEETEQLKSDETEQLRSEEREQLSEETEQLRSDETEQLRSDEREQLSEEIEQLRSDETEQLRSEEREQLRSEETEQLSSEETEQLRSDETEQLRSEETEQLSSEETEQLRSDETEQLRSDEREQLRSDETEQLRSDEIEQLRSDEIEQLSSEETEQLRSDETEQLRSEEREQLRNDEREQLRSDEREHSGNDEFGTEPSDTVRYRREWDRYASYLRFSLTSAWPSRLAAAGFYYTGTGDRVVCFSCGQSYDHWRAGDNPIEIHGQISPSCRFVLGEEESEPIRVSENAEQIVQEFLGRLTVSSVLPAVQSETLRNRSESESSVSDNELFGVSETPRNNVDDIVTSVGHENIDISAVSLTGTLASATNTSCMPTFTGNICSMPSSTVSSTSTVNISDMATNTVSLPDNAAVLSFTGQSSVSGGAVASNDSHQSSSQLSPSNLPILQLSGFLSGSSSTSALRLHAAHHSDYVKVQRRISSFEHRWPHHDNHSSRELAEAGFFFSGNSRDSTSCFYCGGELRNWMQGDNPYVEHARWFPRCDFIRQVKGDNFVDLVQEMNENEVEINYDQVMDILNDCRPTFERLGIKTRQVDKFLISEEKSGECNETTRNRELATAASLLDDNEELNCKVSLGKKVRMVFLPCGHLCCCEDCASRRRICPICREIILATVRASLC